MTKDDMLIEKILQAGEKKVDFVVIASAIASKLREELYKNEVYQKKLKANEGGITITKLNGVTVREPSISLKAKKLAKEVVDAENIDSLKDAVKTYWEFIEEKTEQKFQEDELTFLIHGAIADAGREIPDLFDGQEPGHKPKEARLADVIVLSGFDQRGKK